MTTEAAVRAESNVLDLFRATRPRQWLKNLLVFAAPLAGGALGRPVVLASSLVAFGSFTAAASGGYLFNDVYDVAEDRLHPDKRLRPLAAGRISVAAAVGLGVGLVVLGAVVAALTDDELLPIVVTYTLLTLAYAMGLKRIPGIELLVVASGFVLRPLAGAAAADVAPSAWFLAVCCLAAVVVAMGKRLVELVQLGPAAVDHRTTLRHYSSWFWAGLRSSLRRRWPRRTSAGP